MSIAANPGGGQLDGTITVTAVDGVATFDDLVIDRSGAGYTLEASAASLTAALSGPFDVRLALTSVEAGLSHACGITPGGSGYCWGRNTQGQLGQGEAGPARDRPARITGSPMLAEVSAGDHHTCAITSAGDAYCWGLDTEGQRGDGNIGTFETVAAPVPVLGGLTFVTITAGYDHTCGLTTGGDAFCWGENLDGGLGDDNAPDDAGEPTPVFGAHAFQSLAAGLHFSCGIETGGAAYCWGINSSGQLGIGSEEAAVDTPVAVVNGLSFSVLTVGGSHACGIAQGGDLYCWGNNSNGELGDGNAGQDSALPSLVASDLTFRAVSAGDSHTCAVTMGGDAYCWGFNGNGALGDDGVHPVSDIPVAVVGGIEFEGITAGEGFTCGWTAEGLTHCWGTNSSGELGNGAAGNPSARPVRVAEPD